MRKVLIIDTSILCVWLAVPGMDDCGPANDKWNKERLESKITTEEQAHTLFVLPLASIIETGNHIAQAAHSRHERGIALADLIKKSAMEETPWAAFSEQSVLWSPEKLILLAESWPELATQKLSLGDATIKDVAEYYAQMHYHVEILTGDAGLKAYEPTTPVDIPRRRQKHEV
jgi:hypothetical protein